MWWRRRGETCAAHPDTTVTVLDPWGSVATHIRLGLGALATSSVARRRWTVGGRKSATMDPSNHGAGRDADSECDCGGRDCRGGGSRGEGCRPPRSGRVEPGQMNSPGSEGR